MVCCSMRWMFASLAFVGITLEYLMRVNLGVVMTVIARANHTESMGSGDQHHICFGARTSDVVHVNETMEKAMFTEPEFEWSSHTQELILSSFFIGYTLTQVVSGWLADALGGKWLLAAGVSISATMSLLGPTAVRQSVPMFIGTRVVAGMAEAVSFPAANTLTTKWAPLREKTRMTSLFVSGSGVGSSLGQFLSGVICSYLSWEATFYIFGSWCLLWAVLWSSLVYETPATHPCISARERDDIMATSSRGADEKNTRKLPIMSMMTSVPAIAWYINMTTIAGFVAFILLINIPLYMKHVLRLGVVEIGVLSSIPYIGQFVSLLLSSCISDAVSRWKLLSVTHLRKIFMNIGAIITSGSLLGICYVECHVPLAVTFMTSAMAGVGIAFTPLFVNAQDLAPRFAGTLFGIGNMFSVAAGFVGPLIVGTLTVDQTDPSSWRNVFYMLSGMSIAGAGVFQLFGSGEEQAWARDPREKTSEKFRQLLDTKPTSAVSKTDDANANREGAVTFSNNSTSSPFISRAEKYSELGRGIPEGEQV